MSRLIHLYPIPQNQVLVVRAAPNIDVGYRFIDALNTRKGLNGLQHIGLDQARQNTEPVKVDFKGTVIELINSPN